MSVTVVGSLEILEQLEQKETLMVKQKLGLLALLAAILLMAQTALASSDAGSHHGGEPQWWIIYMLTLWGLIICVFAQKRYLVLNEGKLQPAFTELQKFSMFLLAGAIFAQLWAHGDPAGYTTTMHAVLFSLPDNVDVTLHFIVNDAFMCLFFGIAAKELTEAALLPNGELRGLKGFIPITACLGGVVGPALVYRKICTPEMSSAWAVPCATDIAFAWLGARTIWGPKHPAVTFLLALAVADDFVGMGLIAAFYPQRQIQLTWLLLVLLGMLCAWILRKLQVQDWPLYIIAGILCWIGLLYAGLHAALALVFVVPFMPMQKRDEGVFANGESEHKHDALNQFEHSTKPLVDTGLFFFGLCNAGVVWWGVSAWDANSTAVFLGLGIGKVIGITLFTVIAYGILMLFGKAELPTSSSGKMLWRDVPLAGLLGGMGFTVALFVASAAGGHDSLKLGALASFVYLILAVAIGKIFYRQQPIN